MARNKTVCCKEDNPIITVTRCAYFVAEESNGFRALQTAVVSSARALIEFLQH